MKFLSATLGLSFLSVALGFQGRSSLVSQRKTSLSVLPIEHLNDLHQHSSLLTDSSAFSFLANAAAAVPIDQSSSDMLQNVMDAAVSATPDEVSETIENIIEAEAEIAQDKGLWYSYINLFKLALNGIHDAIDGPLKSAGITQTWGISIALFTASEFIYYDDLLM